MDWKWLLVWSMVSGLLLACGSKPTKASTTEEDVKVPVAAALTTGTVHSGVACSGSPDLHYAVRIPEKIKGTLILLDAHARGKLVVERYGTLADSLGWVLAVSESSKNGQPLDHQMSIVDALLADLGQRGLTGHGPLWVGGFSGGARAASMVAERHLEVQGVLCLGAGPAQGVLVRTLGCDVLLAAGRQDINYSELVEVAESLGDAKLRHAFADWEGSHAWPSVGVMSDLLGWLARSEQAPREVIWRTTFEEGEEWLKQEMEMRGQLGMELGVKPVAEWKPLLAGLWNRAKKDNSQGVRDMHNRVLGYLSLMCYLQAEAAIEKANAPAMEYWTSLYLLVDPPNAETQVLRAIVLASQQRHDEALACLDAAAELGFADAERLESLPALLSVRQGANWQAVLAKVKANPATL